MNTKTQKHNKIKHLTIRIDSELYNKYVKKALDKSIIDQKIIKLSEIIRDVLEQNA